MKEDKGQFLDIVIFIQAGLVQRVFKALQFGRHHAVAQIHRRV